VRKIQVLVARFFIAEFRRLACTSSVAALAFGVRRLAFGVWRLALGVWRLAFGVLTNHPSTITHHASVLLLRRWSWLVFAATACRRFVSATAWMINRLIMLDGTTPPPSGLRVALGVVAGCGCGAGAAWCTGGAAGVAWCGAGVAFFNCYVLSDFFEDAAAA
jgi:hypothetical protein